jgi:peptide chain release factor 3
LDQLLLEGVAQAFRLKDTASRVPLLAAVGPLQFEVLQYRLETEYGAETRREAAPFGAVRWLPRGTMTETLDALSLPTGGRFAYDIDDNAVALFPSDWALTYFAQNHPNLALSALPPVRQN